MPKPQFVQGWFLPMDPGAHPEHPIAPGGPETPSGPVDPGYGVPGPPYPGIWPGGKPEHPIVIPPLVGIWPPPGHPAHPIVLPPESLPPTSGPIYVQGTPENPVTTAAGTLQPPLPASSLPPAKVGLLVQVVGVEGERWLTYDNTPSVNPLGR